MVIRIGDLAKRTGLSVRTLRHYDALGLLTPSLRTDKAYRLYTPDDLTRLLQIQSLKSLGLSLREIARALHDPTFDAQASLRQHVAVLNARIAQEQALVRRLTALQTVAEAGWPQVAEAIALSQRVERFMRVAREVGERVGLTGDQLASVQLDPPPDDDWGQLVADVLAGLESGLEPHSGEARRLADRWAALIRHATSGRADVARVLKQAWEATLPAEFTAVWSFLALASAQPSPEEAWHGAIRELQHPDKNVRIQAALTLGAARHLPALPALTAQLTQDPDFFVRETLTWALNCMAEAALPLILPLLDAPNPAVRLQAVHTLSKMADARAQEALLRSLQDPDPDVARKTVFALGQLKDEVSLRVLIAGLGAPDAEQRTTLSNVLEGQGERAVAPLLTALREESSDVRSHAAEVLGRIGHPDATSALTGLLHDQHWEVRFAALSALGHLPGHAATTALSQMAETDEPRLRAVARRLLQDRRAASEPPATPQPATAQPGTAQPAIAQPATARPSGE